MDERDVQGRNREAAERLKSNPRGVQVGRRPGLRGAKERDEVVEEVLRELGRDARRPRGDSTADLYLQQLVREQREVFQELSRESGDAYDGFLDSLDVYQEEISRLQKPGLSGYLPGLKAGPLNVYIERVELIDGSYGGPAHARGRARRKPFGRALSARRFDGVNPQATVFYAATD